MVYVFLDTNIIFDFTDTRDKNILVILKNFLRKNNDSSLFCTTDYIEVFEIGEKSYSKPFLEELKKEGIIKIININADLCQFSPPKNIDLGEWSIYLAIRKMIENRKVCCVLCGDGYARKFFEKEGLLPCRHIIPPDNGVGGTKGILNHLKCIGIINEEEKEKVIKVMKSSGRRLP